MTITTRINNRGMAGMNLIDKRTVTVEARDDDTVEALLLGPVDTHDAATTPATR